MKNKFRFSFLHLQVKTATGVAVTAGVMAVLIAAVYAFGIPNPNMILVAGLVVCSALFGYAGGVAAVLIMLGYTLYFFSTGNDFTTFTDVNRSKVFVMLLGAVADMLFVCELKRAELNAYREVERLTSALESDNRLLQEVSLTDALTGLRNRYALRRDYPLYMGRRVHVIMLDVDNFKSINDDFGHAEGDRVLAETGRLLQSVFGPDQCYRYGGDEFLAILPDLTGGELDALLLKLQARRPSQSGSGKGPKVSYSIGFVQDTVMHPGDLRELFSKADERMYASKQQGKGGAPAHA